MMKAPVLATQGFPAQTRPLYALKSPPAQRRKRPFAIVEEGPACGLRPFLLWKKQCTALLKTLGSPDALTIELFLAAEHKLFS